METTLDANQLAKLRTMSRSVGFLFWVGVFGIVLSFFENSIFWTCFITLTGWIGIVMGLVGGPGYADYLLKRLPNDRKVSGTTVTFMSLVTYWIPTLATAVFAMALTGALREDLRPQSNLDDKNVALIPQVLVMYFIAAGMTWIIVGREVKRAQRQGEPE